MKRYRARIITGILLILALFLAGCAGLQFKMNVENKLAIAKEGGYQLTARLLRELPEGEAKEQLEKNIEAEFLALRSDLGNEELPLDASYLKVKLYAWIEKALNEIDTPLSEEDKRLIIKTQDFFALEGGYEATPEQRVIGIAFCDGVLEGI